MPIITVGLFPDRTLEQRREFAREATALAERVFAVESSKVRITFHTLERHDVAVGGLLVSDRDEHDVDAAGD